MTCPFGMAYSQGRTVGMDAFLAKLIKSSGGTHGFISLFQPLVFYDMLRRMLQAWQCSTGIIQEAKGEI